MKKLWGVKDILFTLNLEISRCYISVCEINVFKCVPHVQRDYFSSFNQSDHCFLVHSTNQIIVFWCIQPIRALFSGAFNQSDHCFLVHQPIRSLFSGAFIQSDHCFLVHSSNQIIVFGCCRCRYRRRCFNCLLAARATRNISIRIGRLWKLKCH